MKILMIGLGSIGQRHLRNIRYLFGDSVDIIAYRVRGLHRTFSDSMRIREGIVLEKEYNIKTYYSLDEALSEKPDVAFITNITSEHIPVAIKVAKAGCDFFIEKPISTNFQDIDELTELVTKNKLIVTVGFQNRYHVCLRRLKSLLETNLLGDVLSVDVEMGENIVSMHEYEDYRDTYMAQQKMGGGVIDNQQIHELDYIQWLFGMPESVYSVNGKMTNLDVNVEDLSSSIYVTNINGKSVPIYVHADFIQSPPIRRCKVVGNNGTVEVDLINPTVTISICGAERVVEEFPDFKRNDMFIDEINDFFKCVKTREQPLVKLDDGVASLNLAIFTKKSAKLKKKLLL